MSEPIWTRISIGGTIGKGNLKKLLATLNDEFSEGTDDTSYVGALNMSGKMSLDASGMVNWGTPDGTVTFCHEHNLSYNLHCEATVEYDASRRYWRPGMKEVLKSSQSGDDLVDSTTARQLVEAALAISKGKEGLLPLMGKADWLDSIISATARGQDPATLIAKEMDELIPVVPELPPLTVK